MFSVKIKRVYEPPQTSDGARVLVDRLWPRGISKEKAQVTVWMKELAPSHTLRAWFQHDPAKFSEFSEKYRAELRSESAQKLLAQLHELAETQQVTLLYAARDQEHNQAVVLRDYLAQLSN